MLYISRHIHCLNFSLVERKVQPSPDSERLCHPGLCHCGRLAGGEEEVAECNWRQMERIRERRGEERRMVGNPPDPTV